MNSSHFMVRIHPQVVGAIQQGTKPAAGEKKNTTWEGGPVFKPSSHARVHTRARTHTLTNIRKQESATGPQDHITLPLHPLQHRIQIRARSAQVWAHPLAAPQVLGGTPSQDRMQGERRGVRRQRRTTQQPRLRAGRVASALLVGQPVLQVVGEAQNVILLNLHHTGVKPVHGVVSVRLAGSG
jgi:hypothetical protein